MKQGFIDLALAIIIGAVIMGIGTYFGLNKPQTIPPLGSTNVVQAQAFTLAGSGVTASANTVNLVSFKLPDASTTIIMANFSAGTGYGTIEPGTGKEEQISFTGITQNADGSAQLTGVTRGLSFTAPCTANSNFQKAHAGGVKFVLSNTACFYSQFASINATNTWSAVQTFNSTSVLQYGAEPSFTVGTQVIDKTYADALTFSGAPNASFTQKGLSVLSGQAQLITGSSTFSQNVFYVPPNQWFNTTSSATTTVPVTNASGTLSTGFIDQSTSTGNYIWNGSSTFNGLVFVNGSLSVATSTFSQLPNIPTSTPSSNTQATSKQYVLTLVNSAVHHSAIQQITTAYQTLATSTDFGPAGANDVYIITFPLGDGNGTGSSSVNIALNNIVVASSALPINSNHLYRIRIMGANSTSSQITTLENFFSAGTGSNIDLTNFGSPTSTISSVNMSTTTVFTISTANMTADSSHRLEYFDIQKFAANSNF